MKLSLQKKIILSFLTVIIITSSFSTFVGVRLIGKSIPIVQDKVRLDLNSAREIYNEAVKEVKNIIRLSSIRFFIKDALLLNNIDSLSVELEEIRKNESLDFLTLTNPEGIVLLRAGNPEIKGDSQAYKEIINKARDGKTVVASTEIMSGEELSRERKELAIQAYTRIVSSPHTNTPGKTEETSGMVIIGAAPIFNDEENIIGILYGGRLLNHNFSIVDKIRDTIYEREKYKDRDVGVVTVFMNDIRVSTNVISTNGERAVGTLVSAEVEKNVLWEGKNWVERAFAVNEWYITAYEPVKNISGNIVGILGIGILENKYKDIEKHALLIFLGISFGGILLSIALCGFLTNSIMRPIKSLVDATRNIADGNMDQQVLLKDAPYEIEALEKAYNYMVSSIKERDEQLRQRAQEEIMKSERLAMVGQLAAGVAHEINNPLGGILLFSGLLLKKAPSEGLIRENLERIEK
ncbi:cache domain-containing protein, partial [bacterium]|nr:cache domain-containing protein [bacterium]